MPKNLVGGADATQSRNRANKKQKQNKLKELTATLEVEGNSLLRADTIIYIQGVADIHEGQWYVTKVSHSISNSGYKTSLELKKNATNAPITASSTDIRTNSQVNTATEVKSTPRLTNSDGNKIPKYDSNGKKI